MGESLHEGWVVALHGGLSPHRLEEVVGADEKGVDAGDGEDLVGPLDRVDVFGLDDDEDLVVGPLVIRAGVGAKIDGMEETAHGALAERRVAGRGHHRLGFGARVDHRHDDPEGAVVENALDVLGGVEGNAHQRHRPHAAIHPRKRSLRRHGAKRRHGRLDVHRRMLEFDRQPIEADAGEQAGGRRVGEAEPRPDARLATTELLPNGVPSHRIGARRVGEARTSGLATCFGRRPERQETIASAAIRLTFSPVSTELKA